MRFVPASLMPRIIIFNPLLLQLFSKLPLTFAAMKTLLLIRHAKSSWAFPELKDFDRPLNKRGVRNCSEMAFRLLQNGVAIDAFVSSPAHRAIATARLFAASLGVGDNSIIPVPALYDAEVDVFPQVIRALNNRFKTVAIFAHNPAITDFANSLGLAVIDNFPTCGMLSLKVDTNDWACFEDAPKELLFFDFPKNKPIHPDSI
jgi:phosphohistidine phosphatase